MIASTALWMTASSNAMPRNALATARSSSPIRARRGARRGGTPSARAIRGFVAGDRLQRGSERATARRRQHPVQKADRGSAIEGLPQPAHHHRGADQAMRALANKFGAHLTFRHGESTGSIDLKRQPQLEPGIQNRTPAMLGAQWPISTAHIGSCCFECTVGGEQPDQRHRHSAIRWSQIVRMAQPAPP